MSPLSLKDVPWGPAGSWLTLTARTDSGKQRLMLNTCRTQPFPVTGKQSPRNFFEIALYRGTSEVPYTWEWTPSLLTLKAVKGKGVARLAFADLETIVFETEGLSLSFLPTKSFPLHQTINEKSGKIFDYRGRSTHTFIAQGSTKLSLKATKTVCGEIGPYKDIPVSALFIAKDGVNGAIRITADEESLPANIPTVAQALQQREAEWRAWQKTMPKVTAKHQDAAEAAWYILWSTQVAPLGRITRQAIYMSKNWMNQIWSWDNYFNALSVAHAHPELAMDQLRIMADHQSPAGAFPDSINDLSAQYSFVKPPIGGWAFMRLARIVGKTRAKAYAKELIEPLTRQTEWWFTQRDTNGNGLCEYLHGNDSGWDNATLFDQGYPTQGADLQAHLTLQMEGLAQMNELLGKKESAEHWHQLAAQQLDRTLQLWKKNYFVSPLNNRSSSVDTKCLLSRIPVLLGHRLPKPILAQLVKDLSQGGPFMTKWGLATQAPKSKLYNAHGYWRGPIWAPSTHLIFDGLLDAGETTLAKEVATRFCDLCAQDGQMWENYDAITGQGLCCPGYSWTSASFLVMAEWLGRNA